MGLIYFSIRRKPKGIPLPRSISSIFSTGERVVKRRSGVVVFRSLAMLAYLCCPAELAEQRGKHWRHKLAPFLRDKLGHRVYDPAEDDKKNLTQPEIDNFRRWKMTDMDRFRRVARKIIAFNLELIERKADYVICYWGSDAIHCGGTCAELTAAHRKGIPVYLVATVPVEQISGWALGCSDHLFSSIDSLKLFLAARFSRERQTELWKE